MRLLAASPEIFDDHPVEAGLARAEAHPARDRERIWLAIRAEPGRLGLQRLSLQGGAAASHARAVITRTRTPDDRMIQVYGAAGELLA